MADTPDSSPGARNGVRVQVPPSLPIFHGYTVAMSREKDTIELCSFMPCEDLPQWKLARVEDKKVVMTCDCHLAEGIRTLGAPALVEEYIPRSIRKTILMKAVT